MAKAAGTTADLVDGLFAGNIGHFGTRFGQRRGGLQ